MKHIVRGVVRRGLQPVASKASISLRVDQDVLEWFKAQGPGYQTRINSVLRAFRDASV
ncbi:MAG TPA: BrnA antitoxin family protein [Ramlibacter sp.]|nr:BrnA antitoxin family protein [Ramlibacter sp.]